MITKPHTKLQNDGLQSVNTNSSSHQTSIAPTSQELKFPTNDLNFILCVNLTVYKFELSFVLILKFTVLFRLM